jgi:hypothetical protein
VVATCRRLEELNLETEIIQGLALAALLFGTGMLVAGLAVGGSVPMIALGLILAALSMELFGLAKARGAK